LFFSAKYGIIIAETGDETAEELLRFPWGRRIRRKEARGASKKRQPGKKTGR
jgi:hypothetical protein